MSLCDGWLLREIGCTLFFPFTSFLFTKEPWYISLRRSSPFFFIRSYSWCWDPPIEVDRLSHCFTRDFIHPRMVIASRAIEQSIPKHPAFVHLPCRVKNHESDSQKVSLQKLHLFPSLLSEGFPSLLKKGSHISDAGLFGAPFPVSADESWRNFMVKVRWQICFPPIEMHWCQRWAFYLCWMGKWVTKDLTRGTKASNGCHAWYGWLGLGIFRPSRWIFAKKKTWT